MAKSPKSTVATAAIITLAAVAAASTVDPFYAFVPASQADEWAKAGFIEVNPNITDESGAVAARITDAGKASLTVTDTNIETTNIETETTEATGPAFEWGDFETPKRTRATTEKYPFSELPAPVLDEATGKYRKAAHFVAATAERPEPWKTLFSTVSTAAARYRKEVGVETYTGKDKDGNDVQKSRKKYEYEREFALIAGEKGGVKGAYIVRTK